MSRPTRSRGILEAIGILAALLATSAVINALIVVTLLRGF